MRRLALQVGASTALLVAALAIGLAFGSAELPASGAFAALFAPSPGESTAIIWNLRLPRLLVAAAVGAHFATAGALLQAVLRNPLADPGVLGISGGACLAAVTALLVAEAIGAPAAPVFAILPAIAFSGGAVAAILVYALAWHGGLAPQRLALCGIAVASVLHLVVAGILAAWGSGRIEGLLVWVAGSLYGRDWRHLAPLSWATLIGAAVLPFLLRPAALIALGDHAATSLGLGVERWRLIAIATAVFLAATAVAMVGPVGFLGLVVPHALRLLVGADPRRVVALAPLAGATLAVAADTVGRTAFVPYEIPIGVLSAIVGVPLFLFQMRRAVA